MRNTQNKANFLKHAKQPHEHKLDIVTRVTPPKHTQLLHHHMHINNMNTHTKHLRHCTHVDASIGLGDGHAAAVGQNLAANLVKGGRCACVWSGGVSG